jgi:indole-3-glycerol phosphate synthase
MERVPLPLVKATAHHAEPPRDFLGAVTASAPHGIHLIAEVKKASPSAGLIVPDFDPVRIAEVYHAAGASALSVLTDAAYFRGALEHLALVRSAVPLPVLRKDFTIDEYQVYEARAAGADAVLLIAEVLGPNRLEVLHRLTRGLKMTSLIEVHTRENLQAVLQILGPPGVAGYLLGINNRDLSTQTTDLQTTVRLASLLPPGAPFVSESGIVTRDDVEFVRDAGACAILVGESLLRADDVTLKISHLLGMESEADHPAL